MKAKLIDYFKQYLFNQYVLEIRIWEVDDPRYEKGLKYSLIFIDLISGNRVLMDNHFPKKPHIHFDDFEFDYEFISLEKLYSDFLDAVLIRFGDIL